MTEGLASSEWSMVVLLAGRRDGDRVDHALLAEYLQVAVHGGESDGLALAAQLGVDLLSAAEAGQADERGGHGGRLLRAPYPGAARMIQCHILQISRPSFPSPCPAPGLIGR